MMRISSNLVIGLTLIVLGILVLNVCTCEAREINDSKEFKDVDAGQFNYLENMLFYITVSVLGIILLALVLIGAVGWFKHDLKLFNYALYGFLGVIGIVVAYAIFKNLIWAIITKFW